MARLCAHEEWGLYEGETGPQPPPAEMSGPCPHWQECPTCKFRTASSCTCPERRDMSYLTAVIGGYERR